MLCKLPLGMSAIVVIGNRTHRVSGPVVKELLAELQKQNGRLNIVVVFVTSNKSFLKMESFTLCFWNYTSVRVTLSYVKAGNYNMMTLNNWRNPIFFSKVLLSSHNFALKVADSSQSRIFQREYKIKYIKMLLIVEKCICFDIKRFSCMFCQ